MGMSKLMKALIKDLEEKVEDRAERPRSKEFIDWLDAMPDNATGAEVMASIAVIMKEAELYGQMPDVFLQMLRMWALTEGDGPSIMMVIKENGEMGWSQNFPEEDIHLDRGTMH